MQNRGQVAMFVILGFIIIAVVGVILFLFSSSSGKESSLKLLSMDEEVSVVNGYVTSCLEDSLKSAVSKCSGNLPLEYGGFARCPDYELDIAGLVTEGICTCIPDCRDFSALKNVEVKVKGGINVEADLSENKKKLSVMMKFPILVKKGGVEHLIGTAESPFFADYLLEQTECVPVSIDKECKATENKVVEVLGIIFNLREGDSVTIGGDCIAC